MRSKTTGLLSIIILLLVTGAFIGADAQNTDLRMRTFEKAWSIVNEKFWDGTFGGRDWRAIHDRYRPLVEAAKTDAEFYSMVNKMMMELETSHMGVFTPEVIAQYKKVPTLVGFGFRELDGKFVVTHVMPSSSAAEAGIKPGLVIAKIDGLATKTFDETQSKLQGDPNTTVKITYLDAADTEHEVTLQRRAMGADDKSKLGGMSFYGLFDQKRLEGNVGYFYFSNFLEFLNPRIRGAVESFADAPGIVIDLRGNSGGDDNVGLKMASFFFAKETLLMITKTRKGDVKDYKTNPPKSPYLGKVVILVDNFSMSASEQFSAAMQDADRAYVIGLKTPGSDMDGEIEALPNGSGLLYAHGQPRTVKGFIVEKNGITPNKEVRLTRSGLLAGHDEQLDAAVNYILGR